MSRYRSANLTNFADMRRKTVLSYAMSGGVVLAQINANDQGVSPSASASYNTSVLNSMLASGSGMVAVTTPGTYYINDTLKIPSNTYFYCGPGVIIEMATGVAKHVIENSDMTGGNSNIVVHGGQFVRSNAAETTGYYAMTVIFKRVTNFKFIDNAFSDRGVGKYAVWLIACEDFEVVRPFLSNCISDGIHIGDSCHRWVVDHAHGDTGDNLVAVTRGDYGSRESFLVAGSITNGVIRATHSDGAYNPIRLVGRNDSSYEIADILVDGLTGDIQANSNGVDIIDDSSDSPALTSVPMRGIVVQNVRVTGGGAGYAQVVITASGVKSLALRNIESVGNMYGIVLNCTTKPESLDIDGVCNLAQNTGAGHLLLLLTDTPTNGRFRARNLTMIQGASGTGNLITSEATMVSPTFENLSMETAAAGTYMIRSNASGSSYITDGTIRGLRAKGVENLFWFADDSASPTRSQLNVYDAVTDTVGYLVWGACNLRFFGLRKKGTGNVSVPGAGTGVPAIQVEPQWEFFRVKYSDLAAAATTGNYSFPTADGFLPRGGVVHEVLIRTQVAFTGGAVATAQLDAGISTSQNKYGGACNCFVVNNRGRATPADATGLESATADTQFACRLVTSGANTNALTAGEAIVGFLWSMMY